MQKSPPPELALLQLADAGVRGMELSLRTNEKKPATGADFAHFRLRVRSIAYSRLSVDAAKEPAAGADIVVADVGVRGMAQSLQTNSKELAAGDDFPISNCA